jgi:hypothetical protein
MISTSDLFISSFLHLTLLSNLDCDVVYAPHFLAYSLLSMGPARRTHDSRVLPEAYGSLFTFVSPRSLESCFNYILQKYFHTRLHLPTSCDSETSLIRQRPIDAKFLASSERHRIHRCHAPSFWESHYEIDLHC